ncbi:MAG: hypothetical protein MZV64_10370 [Ignavibacteriales bacterium]|nr:hypothetical protein [Ignavibacteriales bacterium]
MRYGVVRDAGTGELIDPADVTADREVVYPRNSCVPYLMSWNPRPLAEMRAVADRLILTSATIGKTSMAMIEETPRSGESGARDHPAGAQDEGSAPGGRLSLDFGERLDRSAGVGGPAADPAPLRRGGPRARRPDCRLARSAGDPAGNLGAARCRV